MPSGIFGATLTSITDGTTAHAPDVYASLQSLQNNGLNNDGALLQTDSSGHIIGPNGQLTVANFLTTPYHLYTNPTLNSGTTRTDPVTGGSTGVPTGAKGIILQVGIFSVNAQGGSVTIDPTGTSNAGHFANFTAQGPINTYCTGVVIAAISTGGQITVKANGANIVLQDWYIFGYFI
jgi:hypothetical protein